MKFPSILFFSFSTFIVSQSKDDTFGAEPRIFNHYSKMYLISAKKMNFFSADRECKRHGLLLAAIPDQEHQAHLAKFVKGKYPFWISFWIGGSCMAMKTHSPFFFYWVHNSEKINYTNWAPNHPAAGNDQCITFHSLDGNWYGWNYYSSPGFICMHPYYVDI